jgi:chemotaxis signal transduction protein
MVSDYNKKLIFRLGGIGFFLDLNFVVEIVDQVGSRLDATRSDIGRSIVAAFLFRKTWIPGVDPVLKFGLSSSVRIKDRVAIVLKGPEGNWAIFVDQVEELSAAEELIPCEIPFLLKVSALDSYSELMLLNNEPYVGFDIERFYDTVPESA